MKPKLILLVPVLFLLVACGGPSGSGDTSSASGASSLAPAQKSASDSATATEPFAASGKAEARTAPALQRAVISKGSLVMESADVAKARGDVLRLVDGWDGTVANEQSVSNNKGAMTSSDLSLRVPSAQFDDAMAQLPKVARTLHSDRSSQDVTTQVIDNDVRVRAQEKSIQRIEQLLAHAKNLGQIISIESDLANRQANLDSLKSQQAYLADQTSMSTIHVSISRPDVVPPVHRAHHSTGLLAGLDTGFSALGRVTVGALTVVGVLAPFAVVLAVIGVPALLVWRRRRPTPVAAPVES